LPEDDNIIRNVISKLVNKEKLDKQFKDHKLHGELKDFRECHIKNDLLLLYKTTNSDLILIDIGSHNQLFK
jgi:mRNA interferase YafQ